MKYHETLFDDYINANKKINFHPELNEIIEKVPCDKKNFGNLILYGHDYVGVDLNERVKNGRRTTHPRFQTVY